MHIFCIPELIISLFYTAQNNADIILRNVRFLNFVYDLCMVNKFSNTQHISFSTYVQSADKIYRKSPAIGACAYRRIF